MILRPFAADDFINALFARAGEEEDARPADGAETREA